MPNGDVGGRCQILPIPALPRCWWVTRVKAKIEEISVLSAHGDQFEIMNWLRDFKKKPRLTFLVHSEPQPCDALRVKIEHSLGLTCRIPHRGERIEL